MRDGWKYNLSKFVNDDHCVYITMKDNFIEFITYLLTHEKCANMLNKSVEDRVQFWNNIWEKDVINNNLSGICIYLNNTFHPGFIDILWGTFQDIMDEEHTGHSIVLSYEDIMIRIPLEQNVINKLEEDYIKDLI